jgi:Tfp pilus assembly protein PilF
MRRRWRSVVVELALTFLIPAAIVAAQGKPESGVFRVRGLVLSPVSDLFERFEVQLFHESGHPLDQVTASVHETFTFLVREGGTYYVVADVPGFRKVRQRVDVNGTAREAMVTIHLEVKPAAESGKPLDLSGEEGATVDVSDFAPRPPNLEDEVAAADEDMQNKDFDKARQRLESVVREAPQFYEARKMLGAAYQQIGLYREAETEFKAARDRRPGSAAPLIGLGGLYLQEAQSSESQGATVVRGILNQALGSLLEAVELNPHAAFGYYLLGVTYYESSLYEDAEENLIRSMEIEPRLSIARLALANVYIRIEEWPRALSQINDYLSENPNSSDRSQILALHARIEGLLASEPGIN